MRPIKPADGVVFADIDLQNRFLFLPEDDWLKKAIKRAIDNFKYNIFCGEVIKKELIPKEYIQKYGINNLMWYQLPNAWRLVYSAVMSEERVVALIIEYFDHKSYARRFGY